MRISPRQTRNLVKSMEANIAPIPNAESPIAVTHYLVIASRHLDCSMD